MAPDRWRKIEELYEAALAVEPERRAAFLEENCGGDESLRREVDSLVLHGENAGRFLESPARMKPPEAGQRISHYQIQEKLGDWVSPPHVLRKWRGQAEPEPVAPMEVS